MLQYHVLKVKLVGFLLQSLVNKTCGMLEIPTELANPGKGLLTVQRICLFFAGLFVSSRSLCDHS